MRRPFIQRPGRSAAQRSRERGVTIALVALAIFSMIAMAGLSIDVGTLYQASSEAQKAADAAALAGARMISMNGVTTDPANTTGYWSQICGGTSSPATLAAIAAAQQNKIAGITLAPTSVSVTYSAGSTAPSGITDCSSLNATSFGVNPVVTVKVTQTGLPTYFSRIWGVTGNTVSGTASAEVFNSSASATYAGGLIVPVQPRCVKPWMIPNSNPILPAACVGLACNAFVRTTDGAIVNPGAAPTGVIGERFWLVPDCTTTTAPCTMYAGQPQANPAAPAAPAGPKLDYVPGAVPTSQPVAIPSDGTAACTAIAGAAYYPQAIGGCDQSTVYQCGQNASGLGNPNKVDLATNPINDTINGVQCAIHAAGAATQVGQDSLAPFNTFPAAPATYPFQIQAGANNPLVKATTSTGVNVNDVITSSSSIMTLPLYDNGPGSTLIGGVTTPVTIVGFLQVFVYAVDPNGDMFVAVMNVTGCGNGNTTGVSSPPLYGTSPVPVRLITQP